ncbi:AMP-binding protein [Heyndrickxia sporothermodurans]
MKEKTIQQLLLESFSKTPKTAVAIQKDGREISYDDCLNIAFNIQQNLKKITNGETGKICIIFMSDPEKIIFTILGIIFTSCVFVPVDPKTPYKRIKQMFSNIENGIAIYEDKGLLPMFDASWTSVDYRELSGISEDTEITNENWSKVLGMGSPDEMLYLYSTSGTTGRPNMVAGRNKSLAHFISWEMQVLNAGEGIRTSQLTDFCHDPYLRDIFLPLCSGGVICIPPDKKTILDGIRLSQWLVESRIQVIHCTPGVFHILCNQDLHKDKFPHLEYIFLGGASPSINDIEKWYAYVGNSIKLVNLYGPTETTLAKMFHIITPQDIKERVIPVGRPIFDTTVRLVKDNGTICKEGQIGEIFISTPYCSLGYYKNKELTGRKFITDPFSNVTNCIMYKTGDLGKMLTTGDIQFIGRKDRQFKIRGYRIEPEEIENRILKFENVSHCVVKYFPRDEEGIDGSIVAYLSPENIDIEVIKQYVENSFPHYMWPVKYVAISSFQLNERGKIDVSSLVFPSVNESTEKYGPTNRTEEKLSEIWKELLNIEGFSREDSFFQLGGSSLNVMSLVYQIYQEMDIDVSLEVIFEYPVFSEMAAYIEKEITYNYKPVEETNSTFSKPVKINEANIMMVKEDLLQCEKIPAMKVLDTIVPFSAIFYRSCFYNAFFTVASYLKRDIPSFLCNDLSLYDLRSNGTFGISYQSIKEYSKLLEEQGLRTSGLPNSDQFFERILNSIAFDTPVIIGVDCYYIPYRVDMYQRNHWNHFVCVVGYDLKERLFYILEHDHVDSLDYKMISISFDDLANSFTNGILLMQEQSTNHHFITLKETDGYKKGIDCYIEYITYAKSKKESLIDSINTLDEIIKRCDTIMNPPDRLKSEGDMLIRNIKEIYQAKTAMIYLLEHFLGKEHPSMQHLKAINDIWKLALLTCTEANIRKKLVGGRWERIYKKMQTLKQEELNFIQKWLVHNSVPL